MTKLQGQDLAFSGLSLDILVLSNDGVNAKELCGALSERHHWVERFTEPVKALQTLDQSPADAIVVVGLKTLLAKVFVESVRRSTRQHIRAIPILVIAEGEQSGQGLRLCGASKILTGKVSVAQINAALQGLYATQNLLPHRLSDVNIGVLAGRSLFDFLVRDAIKQVTQIQEFTTARGMLSAIRRQNFDVVIVVDRRGLRAKHFLTTLRKTELPAQALPVIVIMKRSLRQRALRNKGANDIIALPSTQSVHHLIYKSVRKYQLGWQVSRSIRFGALDYDESLVLPLSQAVQFEAPDDSAATTYIEPAAWDQPEATRFARLRRKLNQWGSKMPWRRWRKPSMQI